MYCERSVRDLYCVSNDIYIDHVDIDDDVATRWIVGTQSFRSVVLNLHSFSKHRAGPDTGYK